MERELDVDAVVIGAGEAGALVASLGIERGARIALVYRSPWGSTCLNVGCVPSKLLIHRARVAHVARDASRFHVETGDLRIDLGAIVAEKRDYVARNRDASWRAALAEERLTLLEGSATFLGPNEVRVGDVIARSERVFIATGMRPLVPPIDGLGDGRWLTNETVMDLPEVPEHLIVVGGGYIGSELGQAFRRFGARVTLIQRQDRLLAEEDSDIGVVLQQAFVAEGIDVLSGHEVSSVRWHDARPTVVATASDGTLEIEASHLLIAAGRVPNTEQLGLEHARVETDPAGFVVVDDQLRTSAAGIWAIGDVNGRQPFTRVAQEEAKVAVANAFDGAGIAMPRDALPHAIFTDPEVGSVGLTAQRARALGYDVIAGLVPFSQVEKAELIGETQGFIKYVAERETHRLLGCHVIGPQAADLVYAAVAVMRARGRIDDLAMAVGVFPTLQEGMEGAARAVLRRAVPSEVSGPLVTGTHGGR